MFKKKYFFIVIAFVCFISISILFVNYCTFLYRTASKLSSKILDLEITRNHIYEIIDGYINNPLKKLPDKHIDFIRMYLKDNKPGAFNNIEFKLIFRAVFKKDITIDELSTVLAKLDNNYSNPEYFVQHFNHIDLHGHYTYKSEIWEMDLFFNQERLEGYEIKLLSENTDVTYIITYNNKEERYNNGPIIQ
jgi:hypothetical protein